MMLTMEDVLRFDIMKSAKIRTGKQLINQRDVQSISVIEMPVEDFVQKNEVVLSTAIGCDEDFLQDLIESEASALVVALGRRIVEIPQEVIDLAETNEFIIIDSPYCTG